MSSMRSLHSSLATLVEDCPICLDEMQSSDYVHLLQCERHCGFNMCKHCIDSLLSSSKDGFQEASDGNFHVKVYLHCPNCRSNLSHSIRDTLLLRKVDEILNINIPETEWTDSQIRLKKALHTNEVQKAINNARKMEAEYYGDDLDEEKDDFFGGDCLLEEEYIEQWGVEADISNGVHSSFYQPRPPDPVIREEAIRVDPTLFAGLDYFLSEDERQQVTELMTRGDPFMCAEAAEILFTVVQKISSNSKPASLAGNNLPKRSLSRRSSVFQLIAEAEVAHGKEERKIEKKISEETQALQNPRSRIAQHQQLERELRLKANFQTRFPIPVRMPKAVQLDLSLPFDMEFVDYTWGGNCMDAYSKLTVGFGNRVTQRRPNNVNVGNILGTEPNVAYAAAMGCAIGLCLSGDDKNVDVNDVYIALPGQSRVLLSQTGRIGKQGAVRGDVLSHIDGTSIAGKNVREVLTLLQTRRSQGGCIMLTLNAELSVAEALKRRAIVIAEI
mmetsp:Transcript_24935/g.27928  ORF Transcript_24935/g.27928 Transcript_24935/m.27928 type:complete len:500 (-) Transcript_24935:174-1673(-)